MGKEKGEKEEDDEMDILFGEFLARLEFLIPIAQTSTDVGVVVCVRKRILCAVAVCCVRSVLAYPWAHRDRYL
jgi:hypothetical protein